MIYTSPNNAEVQEEGAKAKAEREERKQKTADTEGDEKDMVRVVINHKSMIIHKADEKDHQLSACCYARSKQAHYEATTEPAESLTM